MTHFYYIEGNVVTERKVGTEKKLERLERGSSLE